MKASLSLLEGAAGERPFDPALFTSFRQVLRRILHAHVRQGCSGEYIFFLELHKPWPQAAFDTAVGQLLRHNALGRDGPLALVLGPLGAERWTPCKLVDGLWLLDACTWRSPVGQA